MMLLFLLMCLLLLAVMLDTSEIETAMFLEDMDNFFDKLRVHLCDDCDKNFRAAVGGGD